jgi:6-pyruvoyltetrahydropterin/6-carboxytetrahydropterin synthase
MFHLTREVRFGLNDGPAPAPDDPQLRERPANGYGGFPSLVGLGRFYTLRVTLGGELDAGSGYLLNIKRIDQVVRELALPVIARCDPGRGMALPALLMERLRHAWPEAALERLELCLTPFLSLDCLAQEHPMTRLSQKFEFAASHRLHTPELDDEANRQLYGKCSNPHGHGHNYEVQVTLKGRPDATGLLANLPQLERIVAQTVIERFDHKYLNLEVPEFRQLVPSVENIANVIYTLLKPALADLGELASVTVWETPKTWCEYSE